MKNKKPDIIQQLLDALKPQVCTLSQAQRLHCLGIKLETYFVWVYDRVEKYNRIIPKWQYNSSLEKRYQSEEPNIIYESVLYSDMLPAYSCEELFSMLPNKRSTKGDYFNTISYPSGNKPKFSSFEWEVNKRQSGKYIINAPEIPVEMYHENITHGLAETILILLVDFDFSADYFTLDTKTN